jgi:plasmid stability protein
MRSITIKGIEPEVAQKLKQIAAKQGKSTNQLALEIIKKSLQREKNTKYSIEYTDLDHLFGRWSDEEFQIIAGKINRERIIDRELWE